MKTISLCMIVKNEAEVLARCLRSVQKCVDEIIIVDTGSTDETITIAQKFTNRVYSFQWCDDFSQARNFAFAQATGDYLLWLDADDLVPPATVKRLLTLKTNLVADVYFLRYDIAFDGRKATFSYYRERLLKNCVQAVWQGCVHECIVPFGQVEYLTCAIEHRKVRPGNRDRNLLIYQKIIKERTLNPREQYYYGRELYDHQRYAGALKIWRRFVADGQGWRENVIDALYLMADCEWRLGHKVKGLNYLWQTFNYDAPRANVCCRVGDYFLEQQQYAVAVSWYEQARRAVDVTRKGGFVQREFYNFYPCLQLCVAYYHLGDIKKSQKFNEMARRINPQSVAVIKNREFFQNLSL